MAGLLSLALTGALQLNAADQEHTPQQLEEEVKGIVEGGAAATVLSPDDELLERFNFSNLFREHMDAPVLDPNGKLSRTDENSFLSSSIKVRNLDVYDVSGFVPRDPHYKYALIYRESNEHYSNWVIVCFGACSDGNLASHSTRKFDCDATISSVLALLPQELKIPVKANGWRMCSGPIKADFESNPLGESCGTHETVGRHFSAAFWLRFAVEELADDETKEWNWRAELIKESESLLSRGLEPWQLCKISNGRRRHRGLDFDKRTQLWRGVFKKDGSCVLSLLSPELMHKIIFLCCPHCSGTSPAAGGP